jgi:recombination protein RecA
MAKAPRTDDEAAPKKKPRKSKAKKPTLPDAGDYLSGLRALRKDATDDFTFFGEAMYGKVEERLPTGSLGVDKLLGGGWPGGRISECAAWEGVGKSTLLDQSIAQHQRSGGIACLIDTEEARDRSYTGRLGVDVDKLIISEAETIEEAFGAIDDVLAIQEKQKITLAKSGLEPPPLLIVWDSLGGTPAKAELEGEPDDAHVAVAARVINMNFRRLTGKLTKLRATLVFANHFYKTIGGISRLVAYGGKGPRYYTSVRLWLSNTGAIKQGSGDNARIVGHVVEAKLRKTRVGRPRPPAEVGLIHMAGIDNSYTLYEWGKAHGIGGEYPDHRWVDQRGRYCYLVPPGGETITFEHTFVGLGEVLTANPEIYQQMVTAFMASE